LPENWKVGAVFSLEIKNEEKMVFYFFTSTPHLFGESKFISWFPKSSLPRLLGIFNLK